MKAILTRTAIGDKYLYEVKNDKGEVLSKRLTKRDYVACTVNGEMFFGRLSLIGKGEHGRQLSMYKAGSLDNTKSDSFRKWCSESLEIISNIAYLTE